MGSEMCIRDRYDTKPLSWDFPQNDMENDMEKDSFGKHRVIEGFVSVLCAVNFE